MSTSPEANWDSSVTSNPDEAALRELGRYLTGTEAGAVAARIAAGATLTQALQPIGSARRDALRDLLIECGLGVANRAEFVAVLRAIEGAHSIAVDSQPVWTMPGHLAQAGNLTSFLSHKIENARASVTCSTLNFQKTSQMWPALRTAAARPEVQVRVYMDTAAAGPEGASWTPSCEDVATQLAPGVVLQTKEFSGKLVRNHGKFVAIDHRFLLVTSANFSVSAEQHNVELGIWIDDQPLTESVERQMLDAEDSIYEIVTPPPTAEG